MHLEKWYAFSTSAAMREVDFPFHLDKESERERETSDLFHLVEAVIVCRHASVVHLLEADGDWILGTGLRTFFCCCSQMSEP